MSLVVITPIVEVMKGLTDQMLLRHPNMKRVYNPELSYDEGVKYLRAGTDFNDIVNNAGETPIFMFNRSALRRTESVGRRWNVKPVERDTVIGTAQEYRSGFGEFEMRFLYLTQDFRVLEAFEMGYVVGEGVKDIKDFEIDLSDYGIGDFKYFTSWKPLEEIQVSVEGKSYTGISGMVTIKGNFLLLRGEVKIIKQIDLLIKDWDNFDLTSVSILPPP